MYDCTVHCHSAVFLCFLFLISSKVGIISNSFSLSSSNSSFFGLQNILKLHCLWIPVHFKNWDFFARVFSRHDFLIPYFSITFFLSKSGFKDCSQISDFSLKVSLFLQTLECFSIFSSKTKKSQQFYLYFRNLNPKFQKNWTKNAAIPVLPCFAREVSNLADQQCTAAWICY